MQKYKLDRFIALFVLFFVGFGLVQLYSASFIYSSEYYGNGNYFFSRQLFFGSLGLLVLLLTSRFPWAFWERLGLFVCGLSVLLLFMTYIPEISFSAGGARRWLKTPFFFRIEPSELFKASLPFLIAFFVTDRDRLLNNKKFVLRILCFLVPLILLLKQPDFGSFFISTLIIFITFFVFGMKWRWVFLSITALSLSTLFLIISSPYRYERVRLFLNPWLSPLDEGFQVIQSFLSFHLGGFWGVGLGNGQSKLFFLPEAHTDFIFSVFAEEWGFIGVFSAILIILLFIYMGFMIIENTKEPFRKTVALGIMLNFSLTVLINIGVVTGLLPTKGLVFPFLSYGGSSLVSFCWSMGLLMGIERHNRLIFTKKKKVLKRVY